ncbi:hypothetical protein WA026_010437 [Henosepilachna vigintioctopunctata]|uniref:Uncharacterized protein n=1 Tax=Henosepilachna vigintioctopunctata TaxID=420089 RepID=A0AAW1VD57_9CUCU
MVFRSYVDILSLHRNRERIITGLLESERIPEPKGARARSTRRSEEHKGWETGRRSKTRTSSKEGWEAQPAQRLLKTKIIEIESSYLDGSPARLQHPDRRPVEETGERWKRGERLYRETVHGDTVADVRLPSLRAAGV